MLKTSVSIIVVGVMKAQNVPLLNNIVQHLHHRNRLLLCEPLPL